MGCFYEEGQLRQSRGGCCTDVHCGIPAHMWGKWYGSVFWVWRWCSDTADWNENQIGVSGIGFKGSVVPILEKHFLHYLCWCIALKFVLVSSAQVMIYYEIQDTFSVKLSAWPDTTADSHMATTFRGVMWQYENKPWRYVCLMPTTQQKSAVGGLCTRP